MINCPVTYFFFKFHGGNGVSQKAVGVDTGWAPLLSYMDLNAYHARDCIHQFFNDVYK